ncbi:universal stress protein [Enterovibrio norvegicus FF-33]|uniref:Universal stress protein n=1 Tax=Enterovibrio norvegicus FF-454 TaxID=1185651 RepID=A0A1E5C4W1_9GAMM|nr:universal stress protein [Enterovibrio norvegicus]OEE60489.1 universal stress protein [Enterovibrio norvegicus FF-454]OEE70965.1 universal stress protein [Enterovibrio norvegicus FF-33]OEE83515.1 universal stress protein [Enterovibrio norvegicus FF-162]
MYKHILVPVDLNDESFADNAVEHAVWLAAQTGATLHLLTALPGIHNSMVASYFPEDAARKMKQDVKLNLKAFAERMVPDGVAYDISVAEGKPYKAIVKTADALSCDLIVMPSHKRSKANKLLIGSVASKVLEQSKVNVLILKPQG